MSEKNLHIAVCDYIRMQYPHVLFNSDLAGSMKLTIGQAVQIKRMRSNRGFPDIAIYEPKNGINGMFLELKTDDIKIFKKNGDYSSEHIKEQYQTIRLLLSKGYHADFAFGFNDAKMKIDKYLKL